MNYSVWAPTATHVTLVTVAPDGTQDHFPMLKQDPATGKRGWWEPAAHIKGPVHRYGYLVDSPTAHEWQLSEKILADPRSRYQPEGPHELSEPFDPREDRWNSNEWEGIDLPGAVIYELHVGTFTQEGTLDAAARKLPELAELGVDVVQLMPVNGFEGARNWGYDGVNWFSVDATYGGPKAYQAFVDQAHQLGLGVFQDVVYNHFGPSGNYIPVFGPVLSEVPSPWGVTINFSGPHSDGVRDLVLDSARLFLQDYKVDGLRLDAVHAIVDHRAKHILVELGELAETISSMTGRRRWLIAESDRNDPATLRREGYFMDAQWSDDFHHGLHVALTGETDSYYGDFAELDALVKTINRGFFHDGNYSSFRQRHHGAPLDLDREEPWQLVVSNQTHDQVGNRAAGDRLAHSCTDGQLAIAAALTLLGPFTPMLFMGEEFAATTPWQFFTDHQDPVIAEATRAGRLREFQAMSWDAAEVPDPQDEQTFLNSKLSDEDKSSERGQLIRNWYRQLLQLRKNPEYVKDFGPSSFRNHQAEIFTHQVLVMRRGTRLVIVNFGDQDESLGTWRDFEGWAAEALNYDAIETGWREPLTVFGPYRGDGVISAHGVVVL